MKTSPEVSGALLRKKRAKQRFHNSKSSLTRTAEKRWAKRAKETVPGLLFLLSETLQQRI